MNTETKYTERPTKRRIRKETIRSIYDDFLNEHVTRFDAKDFTIMGVRLMRDDRPVTAAVEYGSRKLFSVEEGTYLCLYIKTKKTFEYVSNLWESFNCLKVQLRNGYHAQCISSHIVPAKNVHEFFVVAETDWHFISTVGVTRADVKLSLGNAATSLNYEDLYLFPSSEMVRGKKGTLSFYNERTDESLAPHSRKYFDRRENEFVNVWYKCNISPEQFLVCPSGAEIEFRYYNEERKLVRVSVERKDMCVSRKKIIYHDMPEITFWYNGRYDVEVRLMGELLAEGYFTIYDEERKPEKIEQPEKLCPAWDKLDAMIGLTEVKQVIRRNTNYMKLMDLRYKAGLSTTGRIMNMIFSGGPGTGKTTVARLIGEILADIGVLSNGKLVECNRESLIDNIIGGTEKKTKELIDKSKGGVLFIDEAYSLMDEHSSNDFGKRVIDTLMPILAEDDDRIVIIAGYAKEMDKLLQTNPGLASRFPIRLHFQDYTVDELMQMMTRFMTDNDYVMNAETEQRMRNIVEKAASIQTFGAGRFIHTFIQNIVLPNMATRLIEQTEETDITGEMLKTICPQDIPEPDVVLSQMGLTIPTTGRAHIGFR